MHLLARLGAAQTAPCWLAHLAAGLPMIHTVRRQELGQAVVLDRPLQ